jgi:hypothetical protein
MIFNKSVVNIEVKSSSIETTTTILLREMNDPRSV